MTQVYICDKCGKPIRRGWLAREDAYYKKYHEGCAPNESEEIWGLLKNFAQVYNVSLKALYEVLTDHIGVQSASGGEKEPRCPCCGTLCRYCTG